MNRIYTCLLALISFLTSCNAQTDLYQCVNPDQFEQMLQQTDYILLDVRTPKEYAEGHLPHAVNMDVNAPDFAAKVSQALPKDAQVAVYCRSGRRSKSASKVLNQQGIKVLDMAQGITGWTSAGKAVTKEEVDYFSTQHGTGIWLYAIKHGSVKMRIGSKWLYFDPVGDKCPPATDYSSMPKADYIFITHGHPDHLDINAIEQLRHSRTRMYADPASAASMPKHYGVTPMPNGLPLATIDFDVKAVAAYNTSADKQQFHPKGVGNGYLITVDGFAIYVAGDTEDIPEMEQLNPVDVAFLPCNLPYTMTPQQLTHAAQMVGAKVVFPYHYGDTDVSQMLQALSGCGSEVRIRQYQ